MESAKLFFVLNITYNKIIYRHKRDREVKLLEKKLKKEKDLALNIKTLIKHVVKANMTDLLQWILQKQLMK